MAKCELVEKGYVKDVLSDTIESDLDYRRALRLLDGATIITEQDIIKPYLEKLKADIEAAYDKLDGYDPDSLGTFASRVDDLIDNMLSENEDREEIEDRE